MGIKNAAAWTAAVVLLGACISRSSLDKHRQFIAENVTHNPTIAQAFLEQPDFRLHYRFAGQAKKAVVVWIHGTPGSWADIGRLFTNEKFVEDVKLVSIDRPGWGLSQKRENPRPLASFADQNAPISELLLLLKQQHPETPIVLVGHSWGGSLAPFIAVNNFATIDGLIVLAAGLSADLAGPRWYNRLASLWLAKKAIPDNLNHSNEEVYALAPQLAEFESSWPVLNAKPVIFIQGDNDKLVDPRNLDFAKSMLDGNRSHFVLLEKQGHLLQVERSDLIAKCVMALVDNKLLDCRD